MKEITSLNNPFFKELKKIKKSKKARKKRYLVEGEKAVSDCPVNQVSYYVVDQQRQILARQWPSQKVVILAHQLFKQLTVDKTPQGVLAVVEGGDNQQLLDWKSFIREGGFYLALEQLQDPGNVGTILRTAEAAGVDAVFLSEGSVDPYHPKAIKASSTSITRLPFFTEVNFAELMLNLKIKKINFYATTLKATTHYADKDYRSGICFFIGSEGQGLSTTLLDKIETCITIPMEGKIESLNVAIASSILMYEAHRQREGLER